MPEPEKQKKNNLIWEDNTIKFKISRETRKIDGKIESITYNVIMFCPKQSVNGNYLLASNVPEEEVRASIVAKLKEYKERYNDITIQADFLADNTITKREIIFDFLSQSELEKLAEALK